jgi:hypothetical protein
MDPSPISAVFPVLFMFAFAMAISAAIYAVEVRKRRGGGPIAPYAKVLGFKTGRGYAQSVYQCEGQHQGSPARVSIDPTDRSVWLQVGVTKPPTITIHGEGFQAMLGRFFGASVGSGDAKFDEKFVVMSATDRARARAALDDELKGHVRRLFEEHGVDQVHTIQNPMPLYQDRALFGSKQVLHARLGKPDPEKVSAVLEALAALVRCLEGVPIHVVKLGGERRAARSSEGTARCPWCHDAVKGDEPDLVACEKCGTVLHEACFAEGGRCPTLGCDGESPERARTA